MNPPSSQQVILVERLVIGSPIYFSDPQSIANGARLYRVQLQYFPAATQRIKLVMFTPNGLFTARRTRLNPAAFGTG